MRKRPENIDSFIAIDFETADYGRDSACALALVRVETGRIVRRDTFLIRPPRREFVFTYIHGITWRKVARKPTFGELWPEISAALSGTRFLAAHNASFDQGVLEACCEAAGVRAPATPFLCSMRLARQTWGIRPTKLPDVCDRLDIELKHHDPLSDAEACAHILLAAGVASVKGR